MVIHNHNAYMVSDLTLDVDENRYVLPLPGRQSKTKMCFPSFPGARARLRRHPHALRALQRTADEYEGQIGPIDNMSQDFLRQNTF